MRVPATMNFQAHVLEDPVDQPRNAQVEQQQRREQPDHQDGQLQHGVHQHQHDAARHGSEQGSADQVAKIRQAGKPPDPAIQSGAPVQESLENENQVDLDGQLLEINIP